MPIRLLIDGYNVAQPIAPGKSPPPNWLENTRRGLLATLGKHLPTSICVDTCVIFDAANPPKGRPNIDRQQEIEIRYAVGYPSADDLLEELIRANHTPKRLAVISSDHRIQTAARRRGATFYDSEPWMDALTDGKLRLAPGQQPSTGTISPSTGTDGAGQGGAAKPKVQSPDEVSGWMREFGFEDS